ncbi:MAG: radical SAM protein, partial [Phascolarctobacterium sp.]|nr:radical SAM protein [Phascolarctobacterium sp.]
MEDYQQIQAIYVHTPFCVQKCLYCDFASYACRDVSVMERYADAVCKEIATGGAVRLPVNHNATIYFGGGTPSALPIECIAKIVGALKEYKFWQQPAEATIEVNPGTADLEKLKVLRALGFDRISFGVQSLNDSELKTIGRIHSAREALQAITWAQEAGFIRISADLIYALP